MKSLNLPSVKKWATGLVFAALCIPFVITSCYFGEDDPLEPYEAGEFNKPQFESASALYNITSGNSGLQSIELTASGIYIVIPRYSGTKSFHGRQNATQSYMFGSHMKYVSTRSSDDDVIYGHYTKKGNGVFVLAGFGTIVVKGGESNAVSLDITLENGSKMEVGAQKADQYESSSKTNALCRTWDLGKVVLHRPDGDITYDSMREFYNVEDHRYDPDYLYLPLQVIFTKSGTYVVIYAGGELAVSTWAWENEETGRARYSWDYGNIYSGDIIDIAFENKQALVTEHWDVSSVTYYLSEAK